LEVSSGREVFIVYNVNLINENVPFYHVETIDYPIANSSRALPDGAWVNPHLSWNGRRVWRIFEFKGLFDWSSTGMGDNCV